MSAVPQEKLQEGYDDLLEFVKKIEELHRDSDTDAIVEAIENEGNDLIERYGR